MSSSLLCQKKAGVLFTNRWAFRSERKRSTFRSERAHKKRKTHFAFASKSSPFCETDPRSNCHDLYPSRPILVQCPKRNETKMWSYPKVFVSVFPSLAFESDEWRITPPTLMGGSEEEERREGEEFHRSITEKWSKNLAFEWRCRTAPTTSISFEARLAVINANWRKSRFKPSHYRFGLATYFWIKS